jgi:hypothetical protein
VVTIALLELVLRAFDQLPVRKNPLSGFQKADSTLGWIGKPDYRGCFRSAEFDALVEHDDLGFRLADYEGVDAAAALPVRATRGVAAGRNCWKRGRPVLSRFAPGVFEAGCDFIEARLRRE